MSRRLRSTGTPDAEQNERRAEKRDQKKSSITSGGEERNMRKRNSPRQPKHDQSSSDEARDSEEETPREHSPARRPHAVTSRGERKHSDRTRKHSSGTKFKEHRPATKASPGSKDLDQHQCCEHAFEIFGVKLNREMCATCLLFIAAGVFVLVLLPMFNRPEHTVHPLSVQEQFDHKMQKVKEMFVRQDKRFWATLKAATKTVIQQDIPQEPAVFLMASTIATDQINRCIAKHFLATVTESFAVAKVPEIDVTADFPPSKDAAEMKINLDDSLRKVLGERIGVAVVHDIQRLPGKAAQILHAYCDGDNAPFKKSIIVFTVLVENGGGNAVLTSDAVEKFLMEKWEGELGRENVAALLSRVGNNIVIAKQEAPPTLQKYCPSNL